MRSTGTGTRRAIAALLLVPSAAWAAPETTAPETTAPEATAPEATAPETTTPEATPPSPWVMGARGYVLTRAQLYLQDQSALLYPILEIEPVRLLHEGDIEAYVQGPGVYAYADVAALARIVPRGCGGGAPDDDDALGCLVINEAYVEGRPVDSVRLLAGRHRPHWGRALTVQYIEALSAPPDVTDPLSQRLGVWMALGEVSLMDATLSAVVAPEIVHDDVGLPAGIEPLFGNAALRLSYAGAGWDAAVLGFWDYGLGKLMAGASGSTILFEQLVLHGQVLAHERRALETGGLRQGSCPGIGDIGIPHRPQPDLSMNVGGYWAFDDGSLAGAEFLHNADGMEIPDFVTTMTTVALIKQQCVNARLAPPPVADEGRPPPLSNTLLGRSYVAVTALRPSIAEGPFEDVGAVATLLMGVDDLSALASARLSYTFRQETTFRLGALVPLGLGPNQFTILPFDASLVAEVQVSF